jgi:alpha-1,6-mannosyltransferase
MGATAIDRVAVPRLAATGMFVRRTLGELAVLAQVVLGAAIVVAASQRRSLLNSAHHGAFTGWFAGPLHGLVPSLTRHPAVLGSDLRRVLLAMLIAWLAVIFAGRAVRSRVVIGAVVALNVIFLVCPPTAATDLFNYIGYARLDVLHHLNPYVYLALAQHGDPVYPYSNWHRLLSPYGPLFTLLMLPTARMSLPAAYWTYKVLVTVASLGLLATVWGCARRLGRPPQAAVAMVGLNPIMLYWELGGKHNDLLMMLALMGGGLLLLTRREGWGGAALATAVAIKASAGLLLPVMVLGAPRRLRTTAGAAAAAIVLGAATLIAFGPHLPNIADQSKLVNPWSIPNVLGYIAGHGGADAAVRQVATLAGIAAAAVCAVVAWRTRRWVTPTGWAALAGVASLSWATPWYILWALPFAALSASRTLRLVTVVIASYFLLIHAVPANRWFHHLGIHLFDTPTARANQRFERSLLADHG